MKKKYNLRICITGEKYCYLFEKEGGMTLLQELLVHKDGLHEGIQLHILNLAELLRENVTSWIEATNRTIG